MIATEPGIQRPLALGRFGSTGHFSHSVRRHSTREQGPKVSTIEQARVVAAALTAFLVLGTAPGTRAAGTGTSPAPAVELVLRNGEIFTLDARRPWAQAAGVAGGRFVFVGSDEKATTLAGPRTRVIDLHGRMLLPGIIDSHMHPDVGEFYNHRLCNVQSFTLDEGYSKLAECARIAPAGDWVVAYGWYSTDNPKISEVTIAKLDAIVPDRKLVVLERDAHTVWVNSRTLNALSITRDTPDPVGGRIVRDSVTGQPTGALQDSAAYDLLATVQHRTGYAASEVDLFRTVVPYLNGLGITSLLDAFADEDIEAAYRALEREGQLSMRVSLAFPVTAANYRTEIPRIAAKRAMNSAHIRVDYVKIFADGNAEDHLANLLGPDGTPGPSTHGYFTPAEMSDAVRLAEEHHLSVYVHSIGDGAAREVLDAVAAARTRSPCSWCRHTLTHLQWIWPSDIARLKQLNVIANIQEGWLAPRAIGGPPGYDYVKDTAAGPLGPGMAERMYPFRQLRDAGARLSAGSDWWFTDENPWNDIEAGATSRDPGIADSIPMLPNHTLDVETLLRARTLGAAYQLQNEKETGSIEVGKRADFVVIDRNILRIPAEKIHETHVLVTFFDGKQVAGPMEQGVADPVR